jgi:hypothetical protein
MKVETIVSAAVKRQCDGKVFLGGWHAEAHEYAGGWDIAVTDGFRTSTGRFVDRVEAARVAARANQVREGRTFPHGVSSEDIWLPMGV